jgi:hypothetical protein
MSGGKDLERAVHALRSFGDGSIQSRARTRERVLQAAAKRARRWQRVVRFGVPLSAMLVFSSAWAASRGYLDRPLGALRGALGVPPDSTGHGPSWTGVATAAAPVRREALPEASASAAPVVRIDDLPLVAPPDMGAMRPEPPAKSAATARTNTAPAAAQDIATALYAEAHRAHFVERDPLAALAAWDAYLRVAPDGLLAPEARYNRAIALARLGRRSEACAALRPFVEGRFGGYRQKEASRMVETLEGGS